MTFSIIARCPRTGQLGMSVSSSSPAVASRCAFARARTGVVASQNVTDPRLGPAGLDLLAAGATAEEARDILVRTSEHAAFRQLVILDAQGRTSVWSGEKALGVNATVARENVAAAGNLLANPSVPERMVDAFLASDDTLDLGARLLMAMAAGQEAGGEAGAVRSAGLLVVDREAWPLVDLRVDWDEQPLERLSELWSVWQPQMHDYVVRCLNPLTAPSYGVPGDE